MPFDRAVAVLRAAGEETRLRIVHLLASGELNVSDLTQILGQSQPRISRHLKLLQESGLVQRVREGAWAFYALRRRGEGEVLRALLDTLDPQDATLRRDKARLEAVRAARADAAAAYFAAHAHDWGRIRSLHVSEGDVETAIRDLLGREKVGTLVDLGTGTGRMLEVLADSIEEGVGVDVNPAMLGIARAALEKGGIEHCRVRHGDIHHLSLESDRADLVLLHQVLHYLDDPGDAVREAARLLAPGGRLLIVDFAPHEMEFLREEHAHRRLGFATDQIREWLAEAGLTLESERALAPRDGAGHQRLTVCLWLGRDVRPAIGRSENLRSVAA